MDCDADFLEDPHCHARTIDFYIKCFYPDRLFSNFENKETERMALMGETPHEWAVRMGVPAALLADWELMLPYWKTFGGFHPYWERDLKKYGYLPWQQYGSSGQ